MLCHLGRAQTAFSIREGYRVVGFHVTQHGLLASFHFVIAHNESSLLVGLIRIGLALLYEQFFLEVLVSSFDYFQSICFEFEAGLRLLVV